MWQVFDRFPRAVRDLARHLGKQVRFEMEGRGDRARPRHSRRTRRSAAPPAAERRGSRARAAGGAAAARQAGRGTPGALRGPRAQQRRHPDPGRRAGHRPRAPSWPRRKREGVVGPEVEILTDDLLLKVLGRPGFSTAERVSSVSGRGVGIDVVLTRVRAHGGAVEIASTPGAGHHLHPAAAADAGHPAGAHGPGGDGALPLPLSYVAETVEFDVQPRTDVKGREAIVLRDRVIPIVHLRALLGVDGGEVPPRRPGAGAGGRGPPLGRGGGLVDGTAGSRRRAVRRPEGNGAAVQRRHDPRGRHTGADLGCRGPRLGRPVWKTCAI